MSPGIAPLQRKELGIAIIGCGRIGSLRAVMASRHPAVRFIALADRDPKRARALAERVGAQVHTADSVEAMSRPEVNAVVVSTIEVEHTKPVMRALELGKPVLVEKPLALDLAEADRIIAAAEQAGVGLRVGFSRRFKKRYLLAKEQLVQGRLGKVIGAAARVVEDPEDAVGFAKALDALAEPAERARLGAAARARAEERSWTRHVAELRELYARLR